jgi:UDP:flavonoid glycosyltransferase YjiC (YdhE family)
VNPTISVARHLVRRGHDVAWAGHPSVVRPLLPPESRLIALDESVWPEVFVNAMEQNNRVRGLESVKFLYENVLVPLARTMIPGVEKAIDEFCPRVIVSDQQAFAGSIVARRRKAAWASFVTTSAGILDPYGGVPKVREWIEARMTELFRENGLSGGTVIDVSPMLVLVLSTLDLVGPVTLPPNCYFVGPSISDRPAQDSLSEEWLAQTPRVLVTLGTVSMERGDSFFARAIDAFRDQPLQVIMVAPESVAAEAPRNVLVRPRVPQLNLMRRVQAVVCHGGHNTVCEALANGVPLVVTPIRDDQSVVAQQVVNAGAGIRLKFGRFTASELREAAWSVIEKKEFQEAAGRIARSFANAGGASRAAELLEELA